MRLYIVFSLKIVKDKFGILIVLNGL